MRRRGRPPYPDVLTPRQWQVLRLVREGLSNEQIALRLGISIDGVKFHVSEILGKLGVSNRNEAARWLTEGERAAGPTASLGRRGRPRWRPGLSALRRRGGIARSTRVEAAEWGRACQKSPTRAESPRHETRAASSWG